jgi:hypothetical protein
MRGLSSPKRNHNQEPIRITFDLRATRPNSWSKMVHYARPIESIQPNQNEGRRRKENHFSHLIRIVRVPYYTI